MLRQKDAVQAEDDDIRQRLASVPSIIQSTLGAQGLNDRILLRCMSSLSRAWSVAPKQQDTRIGSQRPDHGLENILMQQAIHTKSRALGKDRHRLCALAKGSSIPNEGSYGRA